MTSSLRNTATRIAAVLLTTTLPTALPAAAGDGGRTMVIPLRPAASWMAVDVYINDDPAPHLFVVDTAANASVIDSALARRFVSTGNRRAGSDVQGASGSTASDAMTLDRLRVGGLSFNKLDVSITDLSSFGARQNVHVDGLLGSDILARYSYIFDAPGGRLTLIDRDLPDPRRWSQCFPNPLLSRPEGTNGFLSVPMAIAPGRDALAVVDTGSPHLVMNWPAARLRGLSPDSAGVAAGKPLVGYEQSAGTASSKAPVQGLTIGATALPAVDARISNLPVFDGFGLKDRPGVIAGMDLWRSVPFAAARGQRAFCRAG